VTCHYYYYYYYYYYYSGDKIENNEVGGVCSAYEGEERGMQGFGWGNVQERTTRETET
jgi:hypothetical protein